MPNEVAGTARSYVPAGITRQERDFHITIQEDRISGASRKNPAAPGPD
jgi:hypothetical protein